jgi:hypothetical protein
MASINKFNRHEYGDYQTILAMMIDPFGSHNPLMVDVTKCTGKPFDEGATAYLVQRGYPNPINSKLDDHLFYEEISGELCDCTDSVAFEDKQEALAFAMRLVVKETM